MRKLGKFVTAVSIIATMLLTQTGIASAETVRGDIPGENASESDISGIIGRNDVNQYKLVEEKEPNDNRATATEYVEGQEVYGTVSKSDKYDYYVVYLEAGVKYYLLAEYPTGTEDYSVYLYRNGASGYCASIWGSNTFYDKQYCYDTYTPRESDYFYVAVRGYSDITPYKFSIHSDQNELTLRKRNGQWYAVYFLDNSTYYGTTLIKYNGKYYYVRDGRLNRGAALVKYNGSFWYVKNGTICKDRTMVKYNNNYWYVSNGRINYSSTLVKYNGSYWYVKNGKLCRDEDIVYYNGSYWYVKNGKLQNRYNGNIYHNGNWWWIENGKAYL